MKGTFVYQSLLYILIIAGCSSSDRTSEKENIVAPRAEKKPFNVGLHGDTRIDNYYWMNDYFKKGPDSSKAVKYLVDENAYLDTMLRDTRILKKSLFNEMRNRIKENDATVPVFKNGYYYYSRYEENKQYPVYCRKKSTLESPEEILADVNEMAKGHPYYHVENFDVSPDNNLMAFGVDTVSRRQYTIYIKNLKTGEIRNDNIFPTNGESEWANDNKTLFYIATNPLTLLTEKIRKHTLATEAGKDLTVYQEHDSTNYIGIGKTKSDKFLIISSRSTLSSEIRYLDASQPNRDFTVFEPRMKDVLYRIDERNGKFLILTNWKAKNFRIMETDFQNTGSDNWKEIIPHRDDVFIEGMESFRDFLVITERKKGLIELKIRNNNNEEHALDFGESTYSAEIGENPDFNSSILRYKYTSLVTPNSVFDYNMITREKKLMKQQEIVGGYNKDNYVSERLFATASDNTKIPVSVVYKKGFKKDGSAPLLLYGYGSYGYSMDDIFSSTMLSLLDRGFAFAIAHIRGGQEMGRQWYDDGKLMKKKNTFTDFIAAADYLTEEKFTSAPHLYALGGSAGGLLIGAVINMRPELWHGVVADVPFVDVVTTMLDESIPLTTNEFDEWGNPKNKDAYDYMKSYSPYDNVEPKNYPNLLVTTGLHDSQVQYFEPAKWVAKLRELKTDNNLLLLKTNMDYGHGGASGRFDYLNETSLIYTFFLKLEGISK